MFRFVIALFIIAPVLSKTCQKAGWFSCRNEYIEIDPSLYAIEDGAFKLSGITGVSFSGLRLKVIGDGAFIANKITSLTIPNSVTTIGDSAFGWNQITSLTILNGVTTIGEWAFSNNKITSLTIPNSVTTIGEWAFAWNKITSLTILNGVTTIGENAFYGNEITFACYEGDKPPYFGLLAFPFTKCPPKAKPVQEKYADKKAKQMTEEIIIEAD